VGCRLHVPVWHEATREWVKQGRLALLGVTQELHADSCRLFVQWKRFDWPILHDPLNLLEAPAVPMMVAIDEHGIVRAIRPNPDTFEAEFLDKVFADDAPPGARGSPDPMVEPYGSELAGPVRDIVAEASVPREPDPKGEIHRDVERLIEADVVVVPARARPGQAARVHVTFRPGAAHRSRWNNESTPLRVWVAGADGWTVAPRLLEAAQGDQPESVEVRRLDFEVKAPSTAEGRARLAAYAVYNTCEQAGGRCLFLRQDLTIELDLAK
jgi:hypothetical protein